MGAIDHDAGNAGMWTRSPQDAFFLAVMRLEAAPMRSRCLVHGSCASRNGDAVLFFGPSGAGKSDLVLRLLGRGFDLVADDQVEIVDGFASPAVSLAGLLEVRGIGIVRLPHIPRARVALAVELGQSAVRLPTPFTHPDLGVPVIQLDPAAGSAPDRVILALDCVLGRVEQVAGAFVA
jgi:HPr kinase/phosphorylase